MRALTRYAHIRQADVSRLKELQDKVAELESETDRLSHALEAQKAATLEAQAKAAKQVEEASKELQKKVAAYLCTVAKWTLTRNTVADRGGGPTSPEAQAILRLR